MRSYVYDTDTYTNLYATHAFYDDQSRMSFMYHSYDYALSSGFAAGVINYSYSYDDITGNLDSLVVSSDRLSATITPSFGWKKGWFNINQFSFGKLQFGTSKGASWYHNLGYIKVDPSLYSYVDSNV